MRKQLSSTLSLVRKQQGASLIEYAVLAALIVVVAVVAIEPLGTALKGVFETVTGKL